MSRQKATKMLPFTFLPLSPLTCLSRIVSDLLHRKDYTLCQVHSLDNTTMFGLFRAYLCVSFHVFVSEWYDTSRFQIIDVQRGLWMEVRPCRNTKIGLWCSWSPVLGLTGRENGLGYTGQSPTLLAEVYIICAQILVVPTNYCPSPFAYPILGLSTHTMSWSSASSYSQQPTGSYSNNAHGSISSDVQSHPSHHHTTGTPVSFGYQCPIKSFLFKRLLAIVCVPLAW